MTAYMNTAHGKKIVALPCSAHYTTQILARMGFFWNASNEAMSTISSTCCADSCSSAGIT